MCVKIVEARNQRTPLGIDDHRAARTADTRRDLGDGVSADQDVAAKSDRSGGIEYAGIADQRHGFRFGARRQHRDDHRNRRE